MKILVVAATRPEIAFLLQHFNLQDGEFLKSKDFDVLITGVGMTATAFALGQKLSEKYKLVLNLGIAGCFNREIDLGTVLNITSDQFAELGAENNDEFIAIDELGFGASTYQASNNLLSEAVTKLKKVHGITVNRVHGQQRSINTIVSRLSPVTESMEGAAVLYACAKLDIPCLQVRSISNYVEPRNKENWKIGMAITHLNQWAIDFLTNS